MIKKIKDYIYNIPESYKKRIQKELDAHLFDKLFESVIKQYEEEITYPPYNKIYSALELTSFENVKVVILGQDPYIHKNEANGLAFSSNSYKLPPSLKNIYKELNYEYGYPISKTGDLSSIAKQGVLLLNTILTVKDGVSLSNKNIGWEKFTSLILTKLNEYNKNIVYLIWGNNAYNVIKDMNLKNVVKTSHPSPLSFFNGFYKSNCFKKVNEILKEENLKEINWYIKDELALF